MKSRIGKLEGDGRTNKRLQESLGKHVKILENALKKEREKNRVILAELKPEQKKDEEEPPKAEVKAAIKRASVACAKSAQLIVSQRALQSHGIPSWTSS